MIDYPEFLLVCEARQEIAQALTADAYERCGTWRFVLEQLDGQPYLEASDTEPGDANRLALLALVRGLEALPGPASVTLLSSSRYVIRSLSDSLPRWRDAGFRWEHFGQRMEVTNADLWRRVDRALDIHAVSACCVAPAAQVGRRIPRYAPAPQQAARGPLAPADRPPAGFPRCSAPRGSAMHSGTTHPGAPVAAVQSSGGSPGERWSDVTDGLRRWLIGQCQSVTGGGSGESSGRLVAA